ncbi:SwmB domain-containing protein [Flammeovirga aprica]|uniref:Cadherin-like beta sandwich domain-containing protein n=1 Tax=Flammeovirga aprica JL-4 TaxID=694437 RepID=A0A7X9RWZ0_9BACT|nr:SwmB domain-containing protein [Flammeovirga aprica]NME70220.1 hypothetical protein [Flammeovirga aprica JL-4]
MKDFFTYIKILSFTLCVIMGIQVQAQAQYPYLQTSNKSIGSLTAITGGGLYDGAGDPKGTLCHNLYQFTRNDQVNATLGIALDGTIDLSSSQEVTLNMLVRIPDETLEATTLMCALRKDGDEATQVTATTTIEKFDEWVDYTFDFSAVDPSAQFNQVIFYLIPDTQNQEADKVQFLINEVKGPKVIQDYISTTAKTSADGKIVTIDFNGHEAIDQFFNPLFKVFNEAGTELSVSQTLINGTSIDLYLTAPVAYGENVTYSYVSGTISDVNGLALNSFEGKEVINNSTYISGAELLYSFGEQSLFTNVNPVNMSLDKNAQDPVNASVKAGKFVRNETHWANIEWDLPKSYSFDFTATKTFSIDVYLEDIGEIDQNKDITLGFKRYDENGEYINEFRVANQSVTCYGKWNTYTFDLSDQTAETLEAIRNVQLYVAPADVEYKGTGVTGYVNNLRGPKIIADQIVSTIATNEEANTIYVDIHSFGALQTVETTGFTVKSDGVDQVISTVSNTEKQIVLALETPLDFSKTVTVSYDDTQGTINDEDGLTLASFADIVLELPQEEVELPEYKMGVTYYYDGTENPHFTVQDRNNTFEVVDNPYLTDEVTDPKVTKVTRLNAHRGITAYDITASNGVIYGNRNLKFKFKVYQVSTDPALEQNVIQLRLFGQMEGNDSKHFITKRINVTTMDQWVEYEFDFTGVEFNDGVSTLKVADATYNQYELTFGEDIPQGGGAGAVDEAFYYVTNFEGPEVVVPTDASLVALYAGGKLMKDFTSDMLAFEVPIPYGETQIPEIEAIATHKDAVISIDQATLPTETTTITVTAPDATTTATYEVTYKEGDPSTVTAINGITVNGYPLGNFDPAQKEYTFTYPYGTSAIPKVEADKTDEHSTVVITPPTELPGDAKIEITAQDGVTKEEYTLKFAWSTPSNINFLSELTVDGLNENFDKELLDYTVNLPFGTVAIPHVTADTEDESSTMIINQAQELPGEATIIVTAQSGEARTYTVKFIIDAPSTDASFKSITVNGLTFEDYEEGKEGYTIGLRFGTVDIPTIEVEKSSDLATLNITHAPTLDDITKIEIIAQDGIHKTVINFSFEILPKQSEDASLQWIALDGVNLENFDPEVFEYDVVLELGTTEVPVFSAQVNDEKATMEIETASSVYGKTVISVQAEDPYVPAAVYTVNLTVRLPSTNTNIASLTIDGELFDAFKNDSTDYILEGYTSVPKLEVTLEDDRGTVNILQAERLGAPAIITVTAEDGISSETFTFLVMKVETPTAVVPDIFSGITLQKLGNNTLNITSEKFLSNCTVVINDIQGKVVYQGTMNGTQKSIQYLPNTFLIIRIINQEGQWFKKIKL